MILVNFLCNCGFVFSVVEEGEVTVSISEGKILEFYCEVATGELRNIGT